MTSSPERYSFFGPQTVGLRGPVVRGPTVRGPIVRGPICLEPNMQVSTAVDVMLENMVELPTEGQTPLHGCRCNFLGYVLIFKTSEDENLSKNINPGLLQDRVVGWGRW